MEFFFLQFLEKSERGRTVEVMTHKKDVGDDGSAAQKHAHRALPDVVRATKKSSTPVASGTTAEKGAADKDNTTTNRNLAQGKESDDVRTDNKLLPVRAALISGSEFKGAAERAGITLRRRLRRLW
jgi:hypothetical protein